MGKQSRRKKRYKIVGLSAEVQAMIDDGSIIIVGDSIYGQDLQSVRQVVMCMQKA